MGNSNATLKRARFSYLKDGLFLVCCLAYGMNRWVIKPHWQEPFLNGYFNDLLLIPCALPPLLWLHRRLKLRAHDEMPLPSEILLHLVVWCIICEWIGPHFVSRSIADPWDVVAYGAGALLAFLWWNWRHLLWSRA